MEPIVNSIVINRPIDEVFDVATCQLRCVVWQSGMVSAKKLTEGPVGVGTEYEQSSKMLGFHAINHPIITLWEPPKRFAYHSSGNRSTTDVEMTFEEADGGTRFTATFTMADAGDLMKKFTERLVSGSLNRMMKSDMEDLKDLMERGEPITVE